MGEHVWHVLLCVALGWVLLQFGAWLDRRRARAREIASGKALDRLADNVRVQRRIGETDASLRARARAAAAMENR